MSDQAHSVQEEPPLHAAARRGDEGRIRALVAAGADINQERVIPSEEPGCRWVTPLTVAAGSKDGATLATVQLLLALGADPDLRGFGRSALICAAGGLGADYPGDAERLRFFLARCPAELAAREAEILACAIAQGDADRVGLLLEHGVYPDLLPAQTMPAPGRPGWRMVRRLEDIPFVQAVRRGNEAVLARLLAAGAEVRTLDGSFRSAMFEVRSPGVARLLAQAGLPPDHPADRGQTALSEAIFEGDAPWVAALLGAGTDVSVTHDHGFTVFMSAAGSMNRSVEVLRLLVAHGADPHAVSDCGWNAFHAAVDVNGDANRPDSVRSVLGYLHELGVDLERRDKRGWTPADRAATYGTQIEREVIKELRQRPRPRTEPRRPPGRGR